MATKTLVSVEEFLPLFESGEVPRELIEGEVVVVSPGMYLHNRIRDTLLHLLMTFLEGRNLGIAVAEQPFHLFGSTVRFPDVAFVASGRVLPPREFPKGAPDLAIEVISPSNTPREIDQKISDFFAAGCKRVWLVYPEHKEIYIHGLSGVTRRTGDEILEDRDLLPGFSVKASSLFE
ncbi:MAG: Uma2 family endonuclease [Acidobacteriota bacterium]|nr:Uma2 family endonuclease [Acidobacteriota bacterium]